MKKRKLQRCPKCRHIYYESTTSRKTTVKIWMNQNLEEIWLTFCKNYETRELAFEELLKRAGLIEEKARASIEVSKD